MSRSAVHDGLRGYVEMSEWAIECLFFLVEVNTVQAIPVWDRQPVVDEMSNDPRRLGTMTHYQPDPRNSHVENSIWPVYRQCNHNNWTLSRHSYIIIYSSRPVLYIVLVQIWDYPFILTNEMHLMSQTYKGK